MDVSYLPLEVIQNNIRKADGFQFLLIWNESITSEEMKVPFRNAAQQLTDLIESKVKHVVICSAITTGLTESSTSLVTLESYESLREIYNSSTTNHTVRNQLFQHNLPVVNPFDATSTFFVTTAQLQAFNVTYPLDLLPNEIFINFEQKQYNYDLTGSCLHELTETMGRIGGFENQGYVYKSLMDLCAYKNEHTRSAHYEPNAYFSFDAGTSKVSEFNTNTQSDAMDWNGTQFPNDCCNAFANNSECLSADDLLVLHTMGFDISPIQYDFLSLEIPLHTHIEPLKNNFANILGIEKFHLTPSLPKGLVFSEETGTISGKAMQLSPVTTYSVTVESNRLDELSLAGHFSLGTVPNNAEVFTPLVIAGIVLGGLFFLIIILLLVLHLCGKLSF